MSKIKTNPSQIKDCIIAVKNSELSDGKKNSIIQVLKQYQQDKQDKIYTDGMIIEKLNSCCQSDDVEDIHEILKDIIRNMHSRKYF
jgi:hypothetical protein